MVEFRKQEQRKFIEKVRALNLSPHELLFEKHGEGHQFRYLDSGITFTIYPTDEKFGKFKYEYTLYTPSRTKCQYIEKAHHLVDILANFDKWLNEHVIPYIEEKAAPDPWQLFLKDYSERNGASKFTDAEIVELEKGLEEFPKFLAEKATIPADKYQAIVEEVRELKKGLKTETKRKWGKRLTLFLLEEVWDAVKDDLIMNEVKAYFFKLISKSMEYLPKLLNLLQ